MPVTRAQMQGWINDYPGGAQTLEDYIRAQIDALNLPDRIVRTGAGDTDVADLAIGDLKSYVLPAS
jgi:hypothetical protein